MRPTTHATRRLSSALLAPLFLAAAFAATAQPKGDAAEVSAYRLNEDALLRYHAATKRLVALPGACERVDVDDEDDEAKSLDDMVAELEALPGAKAAVESAGMSPREYFLFSIALMQSGMGAWALDQGGKLPAGVAQANVDFFNENKDRLEALFEDTNCPDADDPGDD